MVEVGPTTITQDRLKPGGKTFSIAVGVGVVGLLLTAVGYAVGGADRCGRVRGGDRECAFAIREIECRAGR